MIKILATIGLTGFAALWQGYPVGAAKAALKAGNAEKARQHYAEVAALTEGAETARPEIAEARAYMARN